MNTQQLRLLGLALAVAIVPMVAANASAQQWGSGVSVNIGDAPQQATAQSVIAVPTHTIALNQQGGLDGTVASIDANTKSTTGLSGLYVFFVRDGQVIRQSQTGSDGAFSVAGLAEGAYSFYAAGKNGLAAYGVYVTANRQQASENILEATTASVNTFAVQQLIQRNTPPQVAQTIQAALQASQGSRIGTEIQTAKQIHLVEGRLYGQVSSLFGQSQPIAGLQVQLIQNGQAVSQVQTDANGTFNVPDVEPGVYDYVIAGNDGYATGRFEAIGKQGPMTQVSYRKTITQLDACLTCPCQSCGGGQQPQQFQQSQPIEYAMGQDAYIEPSYANTHSAPVEYAGESISYGGASGGTCGACSNYTNFGGGGIVRGRFGGGRLLGGGGGGLSRLLTLGALGGGIVAIADDDSGPSSPVNGN